MASENWSQQLPRPIVIPDLPLTLRTLAAARALMRHLPAEHRERRYWQNIGSELEKAAADGGVADAVIACASRSCSEGSGTVSEIEAAAPG